MKTNRIISTPYDGKFTKVEIHEVETESWEKFPWEVVKRTNDNPVVSALVENITNNTFVLVEQYRPPVWKKVVELIAWVVDKAWYSKEDIIKAEILEETGYTAQQIQLLIENSPKSPGIISELNSSYYAQVTWERWQQNLQDNEAIEVLEFEKQDLNKFLDSKKKEWILVSSEIYTIIWAMMSRGINILK
jgi:8-oxo-dGTP pyrophosphatase MutT (NUDIX family)